MSAFVAKSRKAFAAAVVATLPVFNDLRSDGVSATDVGMIVGAFLVSFGVVYFMPNATDAEDAA